MLYYNGVTEHVGNGDTFGQAWAGGAILNDHSTLTVSNCTIDGNIGLGGGICNDGSSEARTWRSTIAVSSAMRRTVGGGIYNNGVSGSATVTINNSTVSNNVAGDGGGAIYNDGTQGSATLTINYSTISDNGALYPGSGGGAIANGGFDTATVTISNSSLSGNAAGGAVAASTTMALTAARR